ncbi:hypothetical protein AB0L06_32575 [Spirillospora sp. NPDC052269]
MRRLAALLTTTALAGALATGIAGPAAHAAAPTAPTARSAPSNGRVCPKAEAAMAHLPVHAPRHLAAHRAYFEMTDTNGRNRFVIELRDRDKIEHARRLVRGETRERPHVLGRIIKRTALYNPRWNFHLDPDSIEFFDSAIEVCDASISYTEEHLDEACGAFLPGCVWCPWSSRLVREIPFYRFNARTRTHAVS